MRVEVSLVINLKVENVWDNEQTAIDEITSFWKNELDSDFDDIEIEQNDDVYDVILKTYSKANNGYYASQTYWEPAEIDLGDALDEYSFRDLYDSSDEYEIVSIKEEYEFV